VSQPLLPIEHFVVTDLSVVFGCSVSVSLCVKVLLVALFG
jgi:hypothetical protein